MLKNSHIQAPRQMRDCSFQVGYGFHEPDSPWGGEPRGKFLRGWLPFLLAALVIIAVLMVPR